MNSEGKQFTSEDIRDVLSKLYQEQPFVTIRDVADEVMCSTETARKRLHELTNEGVIEARAVGASAVVWYPASWGEKAVEIQSTSTDGQREAERLETDEDTQHVLFFPSRREIVIESPSDQAQNILAKTAHLVDSTGDGYLYKISTEDVWNAPYDSFKALCSDLKQIIGDLWDGGFESRLRNDWNRAHQFRLRSHSNGYTILEAADTEVFNDVAKRKLDHNTHYTEFLSDTELRIRSGGEAAVKETLYEEGYPVIDERRLDDGATLDVELIPDLSLRDYQQEWVNSFLERKAGVFAGPSGSGKTVAAIGSIVALKGETLILVPRRELCRQWKRELLDKTTLAPDQIGEYHGDTKQVRPVTIATYDTAAMSRHRELFNERAWGLVIADECHHSLASTWKRFREIQSTARLGLSATPVREADDSKELYTLIGPPIGTDWGKLFTEEWVSKPDVTIITVPWASDAHRQRFQRASGNRKMIEAARNPAKIDVIQSLLRRHESQKTLIFVDWIRQGSELADALDLPFIYGETPHAEREELYEAFRENREEALIVSRVGDEGIDLPDAGVAILGSTMGSSRAQTGQRTGRTMRPAGSSQAYVLLTKGSSEEDWGRESTQYLAEKGIDVTQFEWEDFREDDLEEELLE